MNAFIRYMLLVPILGAIVFCGRLFAFDTCSFEESSGVFYGRDGQKIILAPGKHVESALRDEYIDRISFNGTRKEKIPDVISVSKKFLKLSPEIPEDISKQLHVYSQTKPIAWIGAEYSNNELAFGNLLFLSVRRVEESLKNAGIDDAHRSKLISLVLGPVFYILYEKGDEFGKQAQTPPIVPLEDDVVKEKIRAALYPTLESIVHDIQSATKRGSLTEEQSETLLATWKQALKERSSPSGDRQKDLLDGVSELDAKSAIRRLLALIDAFLNSTDVRDFHMAKNALAQGGTGIIFVGTKHADEKSKGLIKMLTQICKGDDSEPPLPNFDTI